MSIDEALLNDVVISGRAFLRLYRWDPPTLSLGRNQPNTFDGLPVVRRPTGGGAVWHDEEVTYAVVAPIAMFGSLRQAFCEIHTRLAGALRSLGVDTTLAPAHPPIRPSAQSASCFQFPTGGEILVRGRKLVGSAQVRRGGAFLQHGSILLDGTQRSVFNGGTTVAAVLGRPVSFREVADAIINTWRDFRPSGRQAVRPPAVASLAPP